MREILFMGKRSDNGEWVYGDFQLYSIQCLIIERGTGVRHKVIPETLGQYTGLTDKNGKEIFEGNIVLFDYIGENKGVNGIAEIIFEKGKFGVSWGWHKDFVCLDGFANTTLEVIGNIHDNPELLQ